MRPRVAACATPRGLLEGELAIGAWTIRYTGLDADLFDVLDKRWGSFWRPAHSRAADRTIDVVSGGSGPWLPPGPPGDAYRLEAESGGGEVLAASYHFALS